MAAALCPECRQDIKLGNQPYEGQRVTCTHCGASLEVINLRPLELDWLYAEPVAAWVEDRILAEEYELEEWEKY